MREAAGALFDANPALRSVRLVGFGTSSFVSDPPAREESLFGPDPSEENAEKREALSRALDDARLRFGGGSLRFGVASGNAEGVRR
jgi:hypothetical protein